MRGRGVKGGCTNETVESTRMFVKRVPLVSENVGFSL